MASKIGKNDEERVNKFVAENRVQNESVASVLSLIAKSVEMAESVNGLQGSDKKALVQDMTTRALGKDPELVTVGDTIEFLLDVKKGKFTVSSVVEQAVGTPQKPGWCCFGGKVIEPEPTEEPAVEPTEEPAVEPAEEPAEELTEEQRAEAEEKALVEKLAEARRRKKELAQAKAEEATRIAQELGRQAAEAQLAAQASQRAAAAAARGN